MKIIAKTPNEYLKQIETERRKDLQIVRKIIKDNLPKGFKETMQYNMIGYVVPLKLYPKGYLGRKKEPLPFISLGAQKHHLAIYMAHIYFDNKLHKWFKDEYKKAGKKLDMGKSCIRFKTTDDLPLKVIGEAVSKISVDEFIEMYEGLKGKYHK